MKKIITLLFILAFTSTSFATRILTIRNSSTVIKNFYALEMIFFDPALVQPPYSSSYLHAVVGHYVQLQPGEFITFKNFHPTNTDDFGYCPTPKSQYKMFPRPEFDYLPTSTFQWSIINHDTWPFITKLETVKCNEVSQPPSSLGSRVIFRGFKIANEGSTPTNGVDYFIPKFEASNHLHSIRETFLQLPSSNNPTLEIHEIIFQ